MNIEDRARIQAAQCKKIIPQLDNPAHKHAFDVTTLILQLCAEKIDQLEAQLLKALKNERHK